MFLAIFYDSNLYLSIVIDIKSFAAKTAKSIHREHRAGFPLRRSRLVLLQLLLTPVKKIL